MMLYFNYHITLSKLCCCNFLKFIFLLFLYERLFYSLVLFRLTRILVRSWWSCQKRKLSNMHCLSPNVRGRSMTGSSLSLGGYGYGKNYSHVELRELLSFTIGLVGSLLILFKYFFVTRFFFFISFFLASTFCDFKFDKLSIGCLYRVIYI